MSDTTTYLVTGANRGIGRGLVEALVKRPHTTVIAGVRNTEDATAKQLSTLPTGPSSTVITVQIDSLSDTSAASAVQELQEKHQITTLDTVIANAGIAKYYGPAASTPLSEIRDHFEVNTLGPLKLFQATHKLLEASKQPKFVVVSSAVGTIGDMDKYPLPVTAYGSSKAAINFATRKIHFENEHLIAFVINPGWVQTDMGNLGATTAGMKEAPVTLEQSVAGLLGKIDNATRDGTSGTFQDFAEDKHPW